VGQLGLNVQPARHEQRRHDAVADQGEGEDVVVGAEHGPALVAAQPDQFAVVDPLVPAGVVAGRPQPAGQAAQHRVARQQRENPIRHHVANPTGRPALLQ
jgi:hypothetical protein